MAFFQKLVIKEKSKNFLPSSEGRRRESQLMVSVSLRSLSLRLKRDLIQNLTKI